MRFSFAARLSLRFMFILTVSVMLLSVFFLLFVRSLVQSGQTEELKSAESAVFSATSSSLGDSLQGALAQGGASGGNSQDSLRRNVQSTSVTVTDIPYYITYIAYYTETEELIATNDPFLPFLEDSNGKTLRYIEKDFFFDGDLDILYYAATHKLDGLGEFSELGEFNGTTITVAVAMNMDNNSSAMLFSKLPPAILLMVIPVLILSFMLSFLLTRNTIKPVVRITKAAQTLTTEKLDELLPLTGRNDEIDELSSTFNELFKRIKADFDRERQFSSDVSHELNTPLTVIAGQTNLLLCWGKENPEQLEKSLNAIKSESKSIQAIIQNLLQISRIESGRIKPQLSKVDVRQLFERIAEEFAAVAPDAKFELVCETVADSNSSASSGSHDGEISLNTDPEMLHQILTVLVSNSVKFSGGKCSIVLSASKTEKGVLLCERDDGPGIAEDALPHVFERFYRADDARTRSTGGSGLGLSIAKTLSDALGAKIFAENIQPHGAIFKLDIPNTHINSGEGK